MLSSIILQHFRNYSQKQFDFNEGLTVVVGANTAGKTNLCEAIMLLSTGKSFRAEKELEMIAFNEEVGRVQGYVGERLEVMAAQGLVTGNRFIKKYLVNNVPRSRNNFVGNLPAVLFTPEELEIVTNSPSLRRNFLDNALEQVDGVYRAAKLQYDKALRQRNALLYLVKEAAKVNSIFFARQKYADQFVFWDKLLINNGNILTRKREEFLNFVNDFNKDIFSFAVYYDKSLISTERLLQYKDAEIGAGVTLVGPQRDDVKFSLYASGEHRDAQLYGSRGQQRLIVLQLKIIQLKFMEKMLGRTPIFILDDIFSELDSRHISLVLEKVKNSQIILTTTHGEFVKDIVGESSVIKLEKEISS